MKILDWILAVIVVAFIGYMGVVSIKDNSRSQQSEASPKANRPQAELVPNVE